MGEITTNCYVDFQKTVREVVADIGYTRAKFGFDADTCAVISNIDGRAPTSPSAPTMRSAAPATRA